jgi:acetylornithine/N-succinyldiaminopimelate aminotransferase
MISPRQLFFENLGQTSDKPLAIEIDTATGCWLKSPEGKRYFDLISGVSVSNVGHNNQSVIEAVRRQAGLYMHLMVYGEYIQNPQVRLAEKLCALLPENLNSVFYTNSGSEAVEGAIKLSRRYTGRHEIISFKDAYHGSTLGALSVTGNESLKQAFRPLIPSVRHLVFNDTYDLDLITGETACVIIEPVQGEAGIVLPVDGFLEKLRNKCNAEGALLIFDEIQTGFGRTGSLFAMDHFGVYPDIVLFAKSFGGGMPLGAFVSSKDIMKSLSNNPALGHITTFGGHPVSCAAGLASLEYIVYSKLGDNAVENGALFYELLVHPSIKEIRGVGLLMAVELESGDKVKKLIDKCVEKGLITDWFLFDDTSFRISPPLIISENETRQACNILLEALDEISQV